ncbi:MAG TPA: metalloregulator ArsR/SmtB family transcription factor [Puia sp.]|jgi:DNA-binding transcriptional ArsR family regulator
MKARRDVYQAIADPTRRAIIGWIASGPMDMNSITEKFDITQQAISLHVRILADCGLVKMKQQGRNRICEAKLGKLSEVDEWISQYRQHYERRLDAMERYIEKLKKERNGKRKK